MPPSDLSTLTNAEREAYVRGLEAGTTQLAAGLDIDRLTIIPHCVDRPRLYGPESSLVKSKAYISKCPHTISHPLSSGKKESTLSSEPSN